jgi:hypothetical protein
MLQSESSLAFFFCPHDGHIMMLVRRLRTSTGPWGSFATPPTVTVP